MIQKVRIPAGPQLAKQCQFDFAEDLSSHSLRRGFATSAARAGADFSAIKRQGGWKNDNTVREYRLCPYTAVNSGCINSE